MEDEIPPSELSHWQNLDRLERGAKVILNGKELKLHLSRRSVYFYKGKHLFTYNKITIYAFDEHDIVLSFEVKKVYCKAGVVLKKTEEMMRYFFPEVMGEKEEIWRVEHGLTDDRLPQAKRIPPRVVRRKA